MAAPPVGRHVAAVGMAIAVMFVFYWLDGNRDGQELLLSHAVLADASVVLLCLTLMLGALARLIPRLRPFVPWGRELGIAMFVTAGIHVAILVGPDLDVVGFFGRSTGVGFKFGDGMWAAANWVGLLALGYALVLAATSNDWSQRTLGRGWKFVQRQAYTLFVLAWLHAAAFVVVGVGHGALLELWIFLALTIAAVGAQFSGFVHTVRSPRVPSPHRAPTKATKVIGRTADGAVKWLAVVLLWGGLIMGSWLLANTDTAEARQVALLCERYDELSGSPMAEIRDELLEVAPEDVGPGAPLSEWLETCED